MTCYDCPTDVGAQFLVSGGEKTLGTILALTDTSDLGICNDELRWSNKLGIYIELLADDTLRMSDTLITAFYDSAYVSNMGKLVRAAQGLSNGKDLGDYKDTLNAITTTIVPEDVWRDVLVIAYDHLLDTSTVADSVGLLLNELFATVFPDSSFSVAASKKADYSSIQLSTLETIAAACPYEYGIGVYMARVMLSERDTVLYTSINDCEREPVPPSEKRGEEEVEDEITSDTDAIDFNLYPNPNTGEFTVQLGLGDEETAEIRIWNVSGQRVHSDRLRSGQNTLKLNLSDGLYLYGVYVNSEAKWNGKVSVVTD